MNVYPTKPAALTEKQLKDYTTASKRAIRKAFDLVAGQRMFPDAYDPKDFKRIALNKLMYEIRLYDQMIEGQTFVGDWKKEVVVPIAREVAKNANNNMTKKQSAEFISQLVDTYILPNQPGTPTFKQIPAPA
jgi:hypothetical protein